MVAVREPITAQARVPGVGTATTHRQALVYCRVSTKIQQEEGTSLDSQETACVAHAKALGYTIGRITREVYSGAELWDRPQLARDRLALKAGQFQALVVYATDRLSRDPIHLAIIAEECERAGVALHFVSETFDFNDDEAALIRYVKGYSSKKEREKIRERSLRGKHTRVLSGKVPNMGPEKYGWRRDKARGVRLLYEPEAAIVRRIYHLAVERRRSCHAIAHILNGEHVPCPGGTTGTARAAGWNTSSVLRILRNPAYKGEAKAWQYRRVRASVLAIPDSPTTTMPATEGAIGRRPCRVYRNVARPLEEQVPLPEGTVPAIVSAELWEAAQRSIRRQRGEETRNVEYPYLLRGLVTCGVCGRKMWPHWCYLKHPDGAGKVKVRTYRCRSQYQAGLSCGCSRVRADDLEAWVWAHVVAVLQHPEVIAAELKRQEAAGEEGTAALLEADLATAEREVAKCERKQADLLQRYTAAEADGTGSAFPWELVEREVKRLEQEKGGFRATMRDLTRRIADQRASQAHLANLYAVCEHVGANLETFDLLDKRNALDALEVHVTANGCDWSIKGRVPLDIPGLATQDVLSQTSPDWPHRRGR